MREESTTPDLVELMRLLFEALNSGDFEGFTNLLAPEAVFEQIAFGTAFEGVVAIRGFLEEWTGAYDGYHAEVQEILDLGSGVVFSVVRQSGHPHGSAGRVTASIGNVASWVDGLVVRATIYLDIDEARAAAERLAQERG
jgi:ketosteroid isomerase-like protein